LPPAATACLRSSMVRRGSTVRVRQRALQKRRVTGFLFRIDLQFSNVAQVWSPLWSLQVKKKGRSVAVTRARSPAPHAGSFKGSGSCGANREVPTSPGRGDRTRESRRQALQRRHSPRVTGQAQLEEDFVHGHRKDPAIQALNHCCLSKQSFRGRHEAGSDATPRLTGTGDR
jgi:hypothetical protein